MQPSCIINTQVRSVLPVQYTDLHPCLQAMGLFPTWSHLPFSCVFPADIHSQEKAALGPSRPFLKGRSLVTRWVPEASTKASAALCHQLTFTTSRLAQDEWLPRLPGPPASAVGGCLVRHALQDPAHQTGGVHAGGNWGHHSTWHQASQVLTTVDLISLGVGSCVGTGMYVVSGLVAKEMAGPGVIVSFIIAAVASILSGKRPVQAQACGERACRPVTVRPTLLEYLVVRWAKWPSCSLFALTTREFSARFWLIVVASFFFGFSIQINILVPSHCPTSHSLSCPSGSIFILSPFHEKIGQSFRGRWI